LQERSGKKRLVVRGVVGAGENESGARRGYRSRDCGAEELQGTNYSHTG